MNKSFARALCLLMVLIMGVAALTGCVVVETNEPEDKPAEQQPTEQPEGDKPNLDSCNVEIQGFRVETNYDGKPIVIVHYVFTNYSSEAKSFWLSVDDAVYQNDVSLNEAYVVADDIDYLEDNKTKEIKSGSSLDVEVAYELNDTSSDLEVEVGEYSLFSSKKISKVFTLDEADVSKSTEQEPTEQEPTEQEPTERPEGDNPNLGSCNVEIQGFRVETNYDGKPIVIVRYVFTNHSNEAKSFWLSVEDAVYQNGVGLNEVYSVADDIGYLEDNKSKEIKGGSSLNVEVAYELNDTVSDLEVAVEAYGLFSTKKVSKVFAMADADVSEPSEGEGEICNLGKYHVTVRSHRIIFDYQGMPILVVCYAFTNNSEEAEAFAYTIDAKAFQNGIGLEEAYFIGSDADYSSDAQRQEIKPGATLDVEVAYELIDMKTDVEVEISGSSYFSTKKVTEIFSILED